MSGAPRRPRPGLAAVTFSEHGGGVAYVARLLRSALTESYGQLWSAAANPVKLDQVTAGEAAAFAARLVAANAMGSFDWVIYNHPGIAKAQYRTPALIRRPYAVQLHGTDVFDAPLSVDRVAAIRGATLRLAPSRFTVGRALAVNPGLGPITVCAHGLLPVDPIRHDTVDHALVGRVDPRSALIVGRVWSVERRKGHDQLLEAWPSVQERVPDAQLVIVGEGDDLGRLRDKAGALGMSDSVVFPGFVNEPTVRALMHRCAVFAMPSRQEGFGLAYAEAMREGMPCIGATLDAAEEVIVDGETGFLVEQADREALADALGRLLSEEALRRRMGEAGRRRYEAEYTFEPYRQRLTAILDEAFATVS